MTSYVNLDSVLRPGVGSKLTSAWCDQVNDNFTSMVTRIAYSPSWSALNSAPAVGNGSLSGYYVPVGPLRFVAIRLLFGSTSNGGAGVWSFSLPAAGAVIDEQELTVKAYTSNGANWLGVAPLSNGSATFNAYLPASSSTTTLSAVQNANSTGASGSGVPLISGAYTFASGSNITISGWYWTS